MVKDVAFCPKCGSELKHEEAEICPNCGMRIRDPPKQVEKEKSPLIAVLCSFFIPGLGQFYNGDLGKGIAFFLGIYIGLLFFVIPGVIVWIFGMYDAYNTSKKMNSGEIPYKESNTVAMIIVIVLAVLLVFVIIGAVIAAFVFGLAGTTQTAKLVGVIVGIDDSGVGKITIAGGSDLHAVTAMYYSIDNGAFLPVKATNTGSNSPIATEFSTVGESVYTGESIVGKRLTIKGEFNDGTEQIIFDKKF